MFPGPEHVMFEFTYKCNSRCIMCTIWKDKQRDMSSEEIKRFFSDPLIKMHLKSTGITGGEPTLRHDLSELIDFALDNCSNVENLYMTTNGFSKTAVEKAISSLISVINSKNRKIHLWINLSLDGIGITHEKVRRIPGAFNKTKDSIDYLISVSDKNPNIHVGVKMTVSSLNYSEVMAVYNFALGKGISVSHMPAISSNLYFQKGDSLDNEFQMSPGQKEIVAKSFDKIYTLCGKPYYLMASKILRGGKRNSMTGCLFPRKSIYVGANGDVSLCFLHKNFVCGNITKDTFSDIWRRLNIDAVEKELWSKYCPDCPASCVNDPQKTLKYSALSLMYSLVKPYVDKRLSVKTKNRMRKIATSGAEKAI